MFISRLCSKAGSHYKIRNYVNNPKMVKNLIKIAHKQTGRSESNVMQIKFTVLLHQINYQSQIREEGTITICNTDHHLWSHH